MVQCLVGFGSNTGDLQSWFQKTVGLLEQHPKIERLKYSQPVRTKAILGKLNALNLLAKSKRNLGV